MKLSVAAVAIAASFVAAPAVGLDRAYYEDSDGDKIILTDEECKVEGTAVPDLRRVVAKIGNKIIEGCWMYDDQSVILAWSGSEPKRYPFEMWKEVITY